MLSLRTCNSGEADAHPTRKDIAYGAVDSQPNNLEIHLKGLSIGHDNIKLRPFFRVEGFIAADKGSPETYVSQLSFPSSFFLFDQHGPFNLDSRVSAPLIFCRHVRIDVAWNK